MCQKCAKTLTKFKTKARYEVSTIKLVLKIYKTLADAGQNTILTEPKEHLSYVSPL